MAGFERAGDCSDLADFETRHVEKTATALA